MSPITRNHRWAMLVWIILGFFLFPLTPPISEGLHYGEAAIVKSDGADISMHQESSRSQLQALFPKELHGDDPGARAAAVFLLVVYLSFLYSPIRQFRRRLLMTSLKFSSIYVDAPLQARACAIHRD